MSQEKQGKCRNRNRYDRQRPRRVRPESIIIDGRRAAKSTEMAERLGISLQAFHRYLREPRTDPDTGEKFVLPAIAIGRAIFVYETDLADYVAKLNRCRMARLRAKEATAASA